MLKRKLRLMLDTNVWLEYFTRDGVNPKSSAHLIEKGALEQADLMFAPSTAKDLFYLLPCVFKRAAMDGDKDVSFKPAAWAAVSFMLESATPAPLSAAECNLAAMMRHTFDDYEDNLLLASAETSECDLVVTRDRQLLAHFPETCVTPERAVELVEQRVAK